MTDFAQPADDAALAAFGAEMTFVRQGVDVTTITGIFDTGWTEIEAPEGPPVSARFSCVFTRSASVDQVRRGDSLTIGETVYSVQDIRPDGEGGTLLILENIGAA